MCAICPCRKRHLERGEDAVEPEKKRKQAASEDEKPEPEADNKDSDEEEEEQKQGDVSFLVTEFDAEEEPQH